MEWKTEKMDDTALIGMVVRIPELSKPMAVKKITGSTVWLVEPDKYPNGSLTTVDINGVGWEILGHVTEWRDADELP